MPLQNRVTPWGEIVAVAGRGTIMGNRGVLHNDRRTIVRDWQVKRWIACVLDFKGVRRPVMSPRTWTELFFLDEATAFAAGHRPCAYCRNADYKRFRSLWEALFGNVLNVDAIDAELHAERTDGRKKRTWRANISTLPDGTFVAVDGIARILWRGHLAAWSDSGYTGSIVAPAHLEADVLTPRSIVAIFRSGYVPAVHPTLETGSSRS